MARWTLRSGLVAISSAGLIASALWVAPVSSAADSPETSPTPSAESTPDESPSPEPSASPSPSTSPSSAPSPSPISTETCDDDSPCLLPPRITDATATATDIAVAWEWPDDALTWTDDVTVLLEVQPGNTEVLITDDVSSGLIDALEPETEYTLVAYAVRGDERSESSEPLTVTTLADGPIRPMAESGDISRLIVTTRSDADPSAGAESAAADLAVDGVEVAEVREIGNEGVVVELDKGVSQSTARIISDDLEMDPRIESVEIDQLVRLAAFPDTPPDDFRWVDDSLWGLYGTNGIGIASDRLTMNDVWTSGQGNGSIVAVLDTGYTAHPDLDANYIAGYDFVSNTSPPTSLCSARVFATSFDGDYVDPGTYGAVGWDNDPLDPGDWTNCQDSSWHGTHVAGTIAAVGNNSVGIIGVAPQAKVQPVRVLSYGGGWNSDIAAGVTWASGGSVGGDVPVNSNPADVINMSLGGEQSCPASIQTAIDGAVGRGSVVVVAAGNDDSDASLFSPANCDNVITVASSTRSGIRSSFSNFGSTVEITAPGSGIWSTLNSGTTTPSSASYASYSGTSMATPHVSGVAALLKAADDTRTPSQILSLIQLTARSFPTTGSSYDCRTSSCGSGLLTAAAAISTAPSATSLSPSSGTTAGGISVTITGTNLLGTTSVTFGGTSATGLTVNSDTSVTVTTPALAAGVTDVVVTTTGGSSTLANAFTFVAPPPPPPATAPVSAPASSSSSGGSSGGGGQNEITAVTPSAVGAPGSVVAFTGWGFSTTRQVTFNEYPAAYAVVSDGHLEVTVPNIPDGVYVVHAILAPEVGRASFWSGFAVRAAGAEPPPIAGAPGAPRTPDAPGKDADPGGGRAADFVTFRGRSTSLTSLTRTKLERLAVEFPQETAQATIVTFTDAQGSTTSTRLAQSRAENIEEHLAKSGFEGTTVIAIQEGGTPLQQRGSLVYVDPSPRAQAQGEEVSSLIVRVKKGRSITINGEVRGSNRVTGPLGDALSVGPYLGLRMYRIDFDEPVSVAVAERVARELARDRGIEFAEPDSLVSAQVSITR